MIGLTEDQLYKLVWQLLVWLLGAFGVVASATWWAKGQLVSSQINGLEARIKNADERQGIESAAAKAEKNELIALKEASEQGLRHQIEGLKNLNAIADQRRQFAEDQLKISTTELERIKSELAELKTASAQLPRTDQSVAPQKHSLDDMIKALEKSTNAALSANNQTGTILGKEAWSKPIRLDEVFIYQPDLHA